MAKTNQIKPDFNNIIYTCNNHYFNPYSKPGSQPHVYWEGYVQKGHLSSDSARCIVYKHTETEEITYYDGSQDSTTTADITRWYILGNSNFVSDGWKIVKFDYWNFTYGGTLQPFGASGGPNITDVVDITVPTWDEFIDTDTQISTISRGSAGTWTRSEVNNYNGTSSTWSEEVTIAIPRPLTKNLTSTLTNNPETATLGVNIGFYDESIKNAMACSFTSLKRPGASGRFYSMSNLNMLPTCAGYDSTTGAQDIGDLYIDFQTHYSSGYSNTSDPFDPQPRFLNIYVSEDLEACKKYIADGTVPDDATIDAPKDDDTDASKNKRTDTDEEDGHPEDDTDDQDDTEQTETQATRPMNINYYHIQSGELASILRWFWNDIYSNFDVLVANTMTGMFGNLTQCIIGLKKFNCPTNLYNSFVNTSTMYKIGRYSLNAILPSGTTDLYSREPTKPITVGSIAVTEKYGNFVDRAPYTSIELYLPFVGIVPLDVNSVMSHTITVTAVASIRTGEIEYHVYVVDSNGKHLISTYTGVCAEEVPYALDNALAIKGQTISKIGSVAGSLIPGISSATNLLDGGTIAPTNYNTNSSNDLAKFAPDKCALIIKRKKYNLPSNFGSKKGYIACKGRSLKGLNGKVWIDDFCLPTFYSTSPTKKEIEEIKRLFKEGVEIN